MLSTSSVNTTLPAPAPVSHPSPGAVVQPPAPSSPASSFPSPCPATPVPSTFLLAPSLIPTPSSSPTKQTVTRSSWVIPARYSV